MRVLVTGMSGVGKSSVVAELRRRGHEAFDADDDGFSEPRADGRWAWRLDDVRGLLGRHAGELVFFAGCSEEQALLDWDVRVLLTVPEAVLRQRLETRDNKDFGRNEAELALVLQDLREVEPLLRASADAVVDATRPLTDVVHEILRSAAVHGRDHPHVG